MWHKKIFRNTMINYETTEKQTEGIFNPRVSYVKVTKSRMETNDEVVDRILLWLNNHNITNFQIVTIPEKLSATYINGDMDKPINYYHSVTNCTFHVLYTDT